MDQQLIDAVIERTRTAVGAEAKVPLHTPDFGALERNMVADCVESSFVSYVGPYTTRFADQLASYTGAAHCIPVVNGTVAISMALIGAGVGAEDEVICPALSFVATANAVRHIGAWPHFIDVSDDVLGLDARALAQQLATVCEKTPDGCRNRETGRMVKAVLPMHCFGLPLDIDAVMAVAADWGLVAVEDAAEALGSWVGDRHCGAIAPLGTLSFNGNKIITTGGGGAVLCQDDAIAARVRHLSTTAKVPHRYLYEHDEVGFNARLPALNAALGVAQMQRLDDFLARKRTLTARYQAAFAGLDGAVLMAPRAGTQANNWLVALRIKGNRAERDQLLEALNEAGIGARPVWGLLPDQPMYRGAPAGPLDAARKAEAQVINLPSSAHLVSS